MTDMSESQLLARAIAADAYAFTQLLKLHDDLLRAYAYRLLAGDHALADDALQDAYIKAFRNIGRFRRDSSFGTWLHRIVHNCCVDAMRRRRESSRSDVDITQPGDHASATVERVAIAAALRNLPIHQRAVVVLVDAHGFDYQEAADVLGIPVGTVRSRLARARTALRRQLEDAQ